MKTLLFVLGAAALVGCETSPCVRTDPCSGTTVYPSHPQPMSSYSTSRETTVYHAHARPVSNYERACCSIWEPCPVDGFSACTYK